MTYKVTARKWRPQTFSEVVHQDHVSKTLQNSIQSGRISHAYLFAGPRGVGKTTMARILAKALNCVEGPTSHPCGVCENCREIRSGSAFDVIEIDGASNNGVDDIRDLREKVNFAPVRCRYKVYIIDEVHMVTTQAFNALLKTLEEPPPHVVFIFATTEIHRIPDTILSRCQKYFFKTIPADRLVAHLKHIAAQEGFKISDRALFPIARAAQGSMRDAQSLLDQVISFSSPGDGAEISEEDALSLLGIVPVESYCTLLAHIAGGDAAAVIAEADRVAGLGSDIPRYVEGLAEMIRGLRLAAHRISVQELAGLSAHETSLLQGLAALFTDEETGILFRIIDELRRNLRMSGNERVNFEMALLDMTAVKTMPTISSLLRRIEDGGEAVTVTAAPAAVKSPKQGTPPGAKKEHAAAPLALADAWAKVMEEIGTEKQYLHFVLKPSIPSFGGDTVTLSYPGGDDHAYYGRILDGKNLKILQDRLSALTGAAVKVTINYETAPAAGKINDPAEPPSPPSDSRMLKNPETDEYESKSETVEKIKNAFHGQIIKKGKKDA